MVSTSSNSTSAESSTAGPDPTWPARVNHACRPNAVGYAMRGKVWIYAVRTIEAGEQITIDYGEEYFTQHIAHHRCGCDGCVTSSER